MAMWRYIAVPVSGGASRRGEIAGESAAGARAALRRAGLRVLSVRPVREARPGSRFEWARGAVRAHLRRRRGAVKAEVLDALATLLDAGLPLMEAVETALEGGEHERSGSSRRVMLARVRESLRAGEGPGSALRAQRGWFDEAEAAMVEAGQHRGEMASVLRALSEQQHRRGEVASRLIGVLAYPALVACVGLGVVVFLSTRPLPRLAAILEEASVPVPGLTAWVMGVGQAIAAWWPLFIVGGVGAVAGVTAGVGRITRAGVEWPAGARRLVPRVARRLALSRLAWDLSRMVGAGVPLVEALRVLAPSFRGPVLGSLGRRLREAAGEAERGRPLDEAFADRLWFDAEWRRLVAAGVSAGELPAMLSRLADRLARSARRQVDRLAAALEPAVVLLLAGMVGVVVLAAVLPLVRLQEIVR